MNLKNIFYPQAIAIVGASTKEGSVGNDILKNLVRQGFGGELYPINPKAQNLYGKTCYASLTSVGQPIDLMLIVVPAAIVPSILEEGGGLGIRAAIVISAGFKEAGNADLEKQAIAICKKYDIAMVGPNCLGVINPEILMNASFAVSMPPFGSVAFMSQSGALCTAVLDYAKNLGIGFSKFMSIGNKAVLDEMAILEMLRQDQATKVIAMYTEQLSDSRAFIEKAHAITHGINPKPVIALKSGKTSAGADATASHTGALAGNDAAYGALFDQSGIIRADSIAELFDFIQIFSNNPHVASKRIAIITNAGGPGVLVADEAVLSGLELAVLTEATIGKLREFLPAAANSHNPIDVLGDAKADRYAFALEAALSDANVDAVIVVLTPQSMTEFTATAEAVIAAKGKSAKPLAVSFMGNETVAEAVALMRANNVACYQFPEQAARALSVLDHFAANQNAVSREIASYPDVDREKIASIFAAARQAGKTVFPEAEALEVLRAFSFPVLKSAIARSAAEADDLAKTLGAKLAFKIFSHDILHKSDVGGVMLDIDPSEAGEKFTEMMAAVAKNRPDAELEGVVMMEMAPKDGLEMILGSNADPSLGSLMLAGLGGIYVEVMKDVSFALAPASQDDIARMLKKLKSYSILEGARGQKKLDIKKLAETIGRLSQLLVDFPEIKEIDINPLLVLPSGQGVLALDCRIVLN